MANWMIVKAGFRGARRSAAQTVELGPGHFVCWMQAGSDAGGQESAFSLPVRPAISSLVTACLNSLTAAILLLLINER